eukprot:7379526-Prymnesium_polylepis.1
MGASSAGSNGSKSTKGARSTKGPNDSRLTKSGFGHFRDIMKIFRSEASEKDLGGQQFDASRRVSRESTMLDALVSDGIGAEAVAKARRKLEKHLATSIKSNYSDNFYASTIALRSAPIRAFASHQGGKPQHWLLPITSVNEDKLLQLLGLPFADRYQVEGLQIRSAASSAALGNIGIGVIVGLTEEQLSSRAIARLATNPLPEVGLMQRRTTTWLVRYAARLRTLVLGVTCRSNPTTCVPLPMWQSFPPRASIQRQEYEPTASPIEGKSDLQVQLHFALFDGSGGYVLKPDEMKFREPSDLSGDDAGTAAPQGVFQKIQSQISNVSELSRTFSTLSDMRCTETDDVRGADRRDVRGADSEDVHGDISKDCFWPPPRKRLHRTTIEVISLHNLVTVRPLPLASRPARRLPSERDTLLSSPLRSWQRREQRPRYNGIHQDCHDH